VKTPCYIRSALEKIGNAQKERKKKMTAYEELKAWCEKHHIECDFWESEYTSHLCARFCDDVLVFDESGKFLYLE
jgi:hypothetical protein